MGYNIPALEKLIDEFRKTPSVGTKSAERMAFYVLGLDDNGTAELANAIVTAHEKIHQCKICRNLTEDEICPICSNEKRDRSTICVVESPRDVIAFERTHEYRGLYHVLHGVISPMNGIGPVDLTVKELLLRMNDSANEVIMATNPHGRGRGNGYVYQQAFKAQRHKSNKACLRCSRRCRP